MSQADEIVEFFKNKFSKSALEKFKKIEDVFGVPYNWPLLEPVRIEIMHCILIDASQAALTLTNHLLEKALKTFLTYNEKNNLTAFDGKLFEKHFEDLNKKYGGLDLNETISRCKTQNLITKEQSKQLHIYREKFRNAFSHANPNKTFGDTTRQIGFLNPLVKSKIDVVEIKIQNLPFVQGLVQKNIADQECVGYFKFVDKMIKEVKLKLFGT